VIGLGITQVIDAVFTGQGPSVVGPMLTAGVAGIFVACGHFAREGRRAVLPDLPIQYTDFAAWQRSWLRGEVLEAEVAYWRGQLAGLPPVLNKPQRAGVNAWVCRGVNCLPPIAERDALEAALGSA